MKRKLTLLLLIMTVVITQSFGQDTQKTQLELHSFKEATSKQGLPNLGALFREGWPMDDEGKQPCAWIRVTFENMTMEDAANVDFFFSNSAGIRLKENRLKEAEKEIWLFVTPTNSTFMEARLDKYGSSNRLSALKLEPKHVYDVVLRNDKTMSISISTLPAGATVKFDDWDMEFVTPATITDVPLGMHTLAISLDGTLIKKDTVEINENNIRFNYDLRKKKSITFKSDPSGATIYINDEEKGQTPLTLELPYDFYKVEARMSPIETDTKSLTVNETTAEEINLEPIKKKTFEVYATYNGRKVDADLYIDGKQEGHDQPSYTLTKPIGGKYNMTMIYAGNSKKKKIKVSNTMKIEQEFKISGRKTIVWPWQREYEAAPMGFIFGYVSKQWVTTGYGEQLKENNWGEEGKMLHGMQLGLHFQPCFSWGGGLYSGIFYELYMSWNEEARNNGYMDQFMEHCLYIPVHLYYRIPFAEKVALSIHGGIGMDCGLLAKFTSTEYDDVAPVTDYYGQEYYPKRFNFSAEVGASLRLWGVQLNFQYSKGLTDHKFYTSLGEYKTIQNKMSVGISWVFN